jgi:DNA-binding transcriptional MocR family regulator
MAEIAQQPRVENLTLWQRVYDHLRAEILDGRLEPGTELAEIALSAHLGVSRGPLREAIGRLAALVAAGGALSFTIPALYLGEPDDPGGGRDPLLLELLALVADGRVPQASPQPPPPSSEEVEALCEAAGLRPERWTLRRIVTQAEQRDWLKIPVLTDRLLPELAPEERSRAIDAAFSRTDPGSWRWERWYGWTAWRRRS